MTTQKKSSDYVQTLNPQGYINNREITNLPGIYLVKKSRDCVIVNKEKVVSRKGYTVLGSAKSQNTGYHSSYDWETNTNLTRSVRVRDDGRFEVYFEGDWRGVKVFDSAFNNVRANFTTWWDTEELLDLLLCVVGTDEIHSWSGGMARIGSFTANTLTIQGYQQASTISFHAATDILGVHTNAKIEDSDENFENVGWEIGDVITVTGSASNDGTYEVKDVSDHTLTLSDGTDLTDEAEGTSVTMRRPDATWAQHRFLTGGTRAITFAGNSYTYSGGEDTPTLTGLTGLSGLEPGDIITQTVQTSSPTELEDMHLSLIEMTNNYVFYGDLKNREVFMSKSDDYTDFGFTTPLRVPGEGAKLTLDSSPTAFVTSAGTDDFYISARKDDWYKISFDLSSEQGAEQIRVKKLPTSTGQAAQSQGAVIHIKNGVAFLTFEPTVDTMERLLSVNSPQSIPISFDIKDDLNLYDLTDAHGLFYQTQIFITLPAEGLVIIYDLQNQNWQPPHTLAIGRLALIDINNDGVQVLCGHSSVSNETYVLYNGYNDNGAPIHVEIHFGYDNYGSRFTQKNADEFATELYMSENTNVKHRVVYDYKGATAIREFEIRGDDESIRFSPRVGGGFGFDPLGFDPLGSLATPIDDLSKYRVIDMTTPLDWFERQRVYICDGVDIRFAVIAYGENVEMSENMPNFIKR